MPLIPPGPPKKSRVLNTTGITEANTMPKIMPLMPAKRQMRVPKASETTKAIRSVSGRAAQKPSPPFTMRSACE